MNVFKLSKNDNSKKICNDKLHNNLLEYKGIILAKFFKPFLKNLSTSYQQEEVQ